MLEQCLFSISPPLHRVLNRARRRIRPLYESDRQKHLRERQTADYLLLSLTNCGRTWLRIILGRAMQHHYNLGNNTNLHDLFSFSEAVPTVPAIKPMHEKYGQFGNRYDQQKVIVLVRDPRDAIVSRYHQHKSEIDEKLGCTSLDDYVCEGSELSDYIQFYNDWQTHKASAQDVLIVRYEDMKADTFKSVERVFDFLQLSIQPEAIHEAIDYASFKNMRKIELEGSKQIRTGVMSSRDVNNPASFKVRKGKIGGYRSELSAASIKLVDGWVTAQLDPTYGYGLEDKAPGDSPGQNESGNGASKSSAIWMSPRN